MKLKFLPAGDAHPLEPYAPMAVGQPARRLGRKFDPKTQTYPVHKPYECDSDSKAGRRCVKFFRRGDVVPADKVTADFLGVQFATPKKGDS